MNIEPHSARQDMAVRDPALDAVRRNPAIVIFGHDLGLRVDAERRAMREQLRLLLAIEREQIVPHLFVRLREPLFPFGRARIDRLCRTAIAKIGRRVREIDAVRSDERRVGKEWDSTCRSRWTRYT